MVRRTREELLRIARSRPDWVTFSVEATEVLRRAVPFDVSCWHTVDPGTILFTGNLHQDVTCSGSWLAEHEYVLEDVNKWWFLAQSGRRAGASSLATHGDLDRSARHRSQASYGLGDELRGAFVVDDTYWGAVALLRGHDRPWFTADDVALLATMCRPIARAFRAALVAQPLGSATPVEESPVAGPGVVIFDGDGAVELISPGAQRWVEEIVELPAPRAADESKAVRAVATRARALAEGPVVDGTARSRVRTRSGTWLQLYGTTLAGDTDGRVAVIIQPAAPAEVAQLVALAYGLSHRECRVAQLAIRGRSAKEMARELAVSVHTVQDHLKSIYDKTGVRSRGELVGQVFLEHYVPRWEALSTPDASWAALGVAPPEPSPF